MEQNKFLTVKEVAEELNIAEDEVVSLAENGKIPAYKIGGVYLRFKPENVQEAKRILSRAPKEKIKQKAKEKPRIGLIDRISDFFYFNDFYILAVLIIILMLIIIFKI
jgi:excisionase family DNA binding protein